MDKKEVQQLKIKPTEELKKMLVEYREKLWTLKDAILNGKVKNVKEMRTVRKDIARIMTFLGFNQKTNNGTK